MHENFPVDPHATAATYRYVTDTVSDVILSTTYVLLLGFAVPVLFWLSPSSEGARSIAHKFHLSGQDTWSSILRGPACTLLGGDSGQSPSPFTNESWAHCGVSATGMLNLRVRPGLEALRGMCGTGVGWPANAYPFGHLGWLRVGASGLLSDWVPGGARVRRVVGSDRSINADQTSPPIPWLGPCKN